LSSQLSDGMSLSVLTEPWNWCVSTCSSESLPNRYSALSLAHVCACVTGFQHSELYRFGRFVCSSTEH